MMMHNGDREAEICVDKYYKDIFGKDWREKKEEDFKKILDKLPAKKN
jgi:hypothetical protein